jgi:hypothetical protein
MENVKETEVTTVHRFSFDLSDPKQKEGKRSLFSALRALGYSISRLHGTSPTEPVKGVQDPHQVQVDLTQLYPNRWIVSTPSGPASLDSFRGYLHEGKAVGHYLVLTPRMQELGRTVRSCGYCGRASRSLSEEFCSGCIGSPHLEESSLWMLRLLPVHGPQDRPPLSEDELSRLRSAWLEAQTTRPWVATNTQKILASAYAELKLNNKRAAKRYETQQWLAAGNVNTSNVILYDTNIRGGYLLVGLATPLSPALAEVWRSKLQLADFPYALRLANGATEYFNMIEGD